MPLKSTNVRYGAAAITIHWIGAVLVLALLGTGFRAANTVDMATKAGILRLHIPLAILLFALTLFRIAWWWFLDRKPEPVRGSPRWQERTAEAPHVAFYILTLLMVASGIAMLLLSGAGPFIFSETTTRLP